MNIKQLNIAAVNVLGLKPFKFEANGVSYKGKPFTLTDPACMNMLVEHFKIDVISYNDRKDGLIWVAATTDGESSGEDPDRDTAIIKCVEKCLEGVCV